MWSVKSSKTRICWNGDDISHLFKNRMPKKPTPTIEFKWRAYNGMKIRVVAHTDPPRPSSAGQAQQYDCILDGQSFFTLPSRSIRPPIASNVSGEFTNGSVAENGQQPPTHQDGGIARLPSRETPSSSDRTLSGGSGSLDQGSREGPDLATINQAQHRLAAAGFTTYQFQMEDELRSELYSSTLDILRDEVAASVPETEDMMSRAIIAAFSEDHDSDASHDSVSEQSERGPLDEAEIEADALAAVVEWMCWSTKFVPPIGMKERKLEAMQRHAETMVSHVRHERLSPHAASKIMLWLAILLGLDVTKQPLKDTVIVSGLGQNPSMQTLLNAMHPYGEIEVAAVSKRLDGFGEHT